MATHHEKRTLPYSPEQIFDLVADVERYQEFLPWCVGSRINWRKGNTFNADVLIGYSFVRETFNSTVTLSPHTKIDVVYQNGPFRHLKNYWVFRKSEMKGLPATEIEFFIDFEFRASFLNSIIQKVFEDAVGSMINAFESRAKSLYG